MTTATSKQLTEGQEGVLNACDKEIRYAKRDRDYAETKGYYEDAYWWTLKIEELIIERDETLEKFLAS